MNLFRKAKDVAWRYAGKFPYIATVSALILVLLFASGC
jgi:hypothetical protein